MKWNHVFKESCRLKICPCRVDPSNNAGINYATILSLLD